jgi:uncharacterized membrane protein
MPKVLNASWLVPAGLVLLGLVPVIAGSVRLVELAGSPEITPANARFVTAPVPVVLHIVSVTTYALLGAFQFSGGLRRHYPRWHRVAGRILVPMGLVAALTGLWMTQFYIPPPMDEGLTLYLVRMAVGTFMAAFLILGLVAIRKSEFTNHQAWMMQAYGLGMGAGTQVLTHLPWTLIVGMPDSTVTRDVLMTAGWIINIIVVEWLLATKLKRGTPKRRMSNAPVPSPHLRTTRS